MHLQIYIYIYIYIFFFFWVGISYPDQPLRRNCSRLVPDSRNNFSNYIYIYLLKFYWLYSRSSFHVSINVLKVAYQWHDCSDCHNALLSSQSVWLLETFNMVWGIWMGNLYSASKKSTWYFGKLSHSCCQL